LRVGGDVALAHQDVRHHSCVAEFLDIVHRAIGPEHRGLEVAGVLVQPSRELRKAGCQLQQFLAVRLGSHVAELFDKGGLVLHGHHQVCWADELVGADVVV
jgi:hypothetical protein